MMEEKRRSRSSESYDRRWSEEVRHNSSMSGTGIEVQVYQTKSCEAVRKQRHQYSSKLTRQTLYREALYTGTHMLGKPSLRFPSTQEDILTYVQISFAKNTQEQMDLIEQVTAEPFPLTIVNVGIQRAEHLASRDNNGLSDPYCLISVETEESLNKAAWGSFDFGSPKKPKTVKAPKDRERAVAEKRYDQVYNTVPKSIRTTIQHQTLNPVWDERFQCLALRPSHDILHIEVWDHDDDDEVVQSIREAKDVRKTEKVEEGEALFQDAFRRGKRDDFIGKATFKVTEIPVEGLEQWFYLQGKTHRGIEAQGKILVQIWLTHTFRHGSHYNPETSPRVMLERLWEYVLTLEAEKKSNAGEPWDSEIPLAATCLLFQYGLQCGLSESSQAVIRFNAYARRHLQMHSASARLKELDASLKQYKTLHEGGQIDHCDTEEMLDGIVGSLKGPLNVIRTHFSQKTEKVDEALKAIRHVTNILNRVGASEHVAGLEMEVKVALRFGIQQWYQDMAKEYVRGPPDQNRTQVICGLAQVVGLVNRKLSECQHRWEPLFGLENSVEYLPLVYDEFQKVVVNDVTGMTAGLPKEIGDNNQQRKILLRMSQEHKALCVCLFELYAQTHAFVQFQDVVFGKMVHGGPKTYPHLDTFHEWFRPVLVLWLGFAFIKGHQLISASINTDEIEGNQLTSYSALETVFVFHQLGNFVKELDWPDAPEAVIIHVFVVEVMTYISIIYAKMKRNKIQKEGYFDRVGQFDISERLCKALNNIHYVQQTVQNLPKELWVDTLFQHLCETVGEEAEIVKQYHDRIVTSIVTAVNKVELEIQKIRAAWNAVVTFLEATPTSDAAMIPLYDYLEPNLDALHKYLFHANFVRLLQVFWLVICQEVVPAAVAVAVRFNGTDGQQAFFRYFQTRFVELIAYLKGNGEGLTEVHLNLPEFKTAAKILHVFTLPSDTIKGEYYRERSLEQMEVKGHGPYGSLRLRVFAVERMLHVELISADNLVPLDHPSKIWDVCSKIKSPSSDPQVTVDLLLGGQSIGPKKKTKVHKKTLSPNFSEVFQIFGDKDGLELQAWSGIVVRCTMKDVDLLSKNDFMGEVLVPLDKMPGVAVDKPKAQPMTLQLREGGDANVNPYLIVLATRKWEDDTKKFVTGQAHRRIKPA